MEHIIEELERAKEWFQKDVEKLERDIAYQKSLLVLTQKQIDDLQEKLYHALSFIAQYDHACEVLRNAD